MSWNIIIDANSPNDGEDTMGSLIDAKRILQEAFQNVEWHSETECFIDHPKGGCDIRFGMVGGEVYYLSTEGGYHQLSCGQSGRHIHDSAR